MIVISAVAVLSFKALKDASASLSVNIVKIESISVNVQSLPSSYYFDQEVVFLEEFPPNRSWAYALDCVVRTDFFSPVNINVATFSDGTSQVLGANQFCR